MMASRRDRRRDEEARDDRAAEEARDDRHHHDKDHKRKKHEPKKHPPAPGGGGGTTTEKLKALSHQSGQDAMNATPGGYPRDPANADAVYTTGPGEVVSYNYVRVDGSGGNVTPLQSSYTAPVAGHGQVLTPAAAGDMPAGMENNPT